MTSKELHKQKIVPLRIELQKLEEEYKELFRKECGEKIKEKASCENCAYSCVIRSTEHNCCMGGRCTCCNDWCYTWIPENNVSRFLREHYHYDDDMFRRLENIFGCGFLKRCEKPENANTVLDLLQKISKFDGKLEG